MKFVLSLVPFLATFSTDELDLGWSLVPPHPVAVCSGLGDGESCVIKAIGLN